MEKTRYTAPRLMRLGSFTELTMGATGSINDGMGGGGGMAEDDGMGGTPMV